MSDFNKVFEKADNENLISRDPYALMKALEIALLAYDTEDAGFHFRFALTTTINAIRALKKFF